MSWGYYSKADIILSENLGSLWDLAPVAYIWRRNVRFSLEPWTGQKIGAGGGSQAKQVEYGGMKKRWVLKVMGGSVKDFPFPKFHSPLLLPVIPSTPGSTQMLPGQSA